jgi:hypothetical protein
MCEEAFNKKLIKALQGPGLSPAAAALLEAKNVKLLPLPQPPLGAHTGAPKNPSAQRATQLRGVLSRVYAVSSQNLNTTTVP